MEKRLTMEVATNNRLPFIGMEIINTGQHLETCVFRKKHKHAKVFSCTFKVTWTTDSNDRSQKLYLIVRNDCRLRKISSCRNVKP